MTTKTTGYENYHFHTHKNGTNLIMGTNRECSRYRTTEYDKGASLYPVFTPAFLKTVNNPYVKINDNKNVAYPKRNL